MSPHNLAKMGIFCHLFTFNAVMKNGCLWNRFRYVFNLALQGVVLHFLCDALKVYLSLLNTEMIKKNGFSFVFRSLIRNFDVRRRYFRLEMNAKTFVFTLHFAHLFVSLQLVSMMAYIIIYNKV